MATGELNVLSEQHILSCTPNPQHCGGDGGCAGGTAELAFQSMIDSGGIASEWKYPYLSWYGNNSKCMYTADKVGPTAMLSGYQVLPSNQQEPLMQAVASAGPIAVSVDASECHLYESGVFNGCNQVLITFLSLICLISSHLLI
jgi:cathepsin L